MAEEKDEILKKREDETDAAYRGFNQYLNMPKTRSLSDLSKMTRRNISIIKRWYDKYDWEKRAAHYDKIASPHKNSDIKDMYRRHIEKALELQDMAVKKFRDIDPSTLTNSEMIRFLSAGANLEQNARKAFELSTKSLEQDTDFCEKLQRFMEE